MDFNEYKEIMNAQYLLLNGLYFNNAIRKQKYVINSSDNITDNYWNFLTLNNESMLDDNGILKNLETDFKLIKRQPSIFIPNVIDKYLEYCDLLIEKGYKSIASDVFMSLSKNVIATSVKNDTKLVLTRELYLDFMEVLSSAYSGELSLDNPYSGAITKEYYIAIEKSLLNKQFNHMILYYNGFPACVATLSYKDGYGIINNVGTKKEFQNLGLGRQMINACIERFNTLGGGTLFLFTESGSKNEKWYASLGFKSEFINEQFIKEEEEAHEGI